MKIFKKILAVVLITSFFSSCSLYYRPMHSRNIGKRNTNSRMAPGFR